MLNYLSLQRVGYGGVTAPVSPVAQDSQSPTRPLGLSAATAVGEITWSWDQSADIEQQDGTAAVGLQRYTLELDGSPVQVSAPTSNVLAKPVLQQIGTTGATLSQSGTSWTLTGAGNGLDGTSDQVSMGAWQITGDFKLSCRISSFSGAGYEYAYSGLLIRESLAVGARFHALYQWLSANNKGVQAKRRTSTNGASSSFAYANGDGAARWLQIERTGSTITYRYSLDGGEWSVLGSESSTIGSSLYIGGFISDLGPSPVTLTSVLEELAYTPSTRVSYVQSTAISSVGRVRANDLNSLVTSYSPTQTKNPVAPPSGSAMRFRPGMGMWSSQQSYRPITDPAILTHHVNKINSLAGNSNIKFIQILTDWAGLEGDVLGNFTTAARSGHHSVQYAVQTLLDTCAAADKTLHLGLSPLHFGNYGTKNYQLPAYLWENSGLGTTYDFYGTPRQELGFGSTGPYGLTPLVGPVDLPGGGTGIGYRGFTARFWQTATADRINAVSAWLGATFGSHAAFDIFVFGETSLNVLAGYNDAGYSGDALRTQTLRLLQAARDAFPTMIIRCAANDFGYDDPHMKDLCAWCYARQIIIGGPSVRRDDVTQADKVFVGKDAYGEQAFTNYTGLMPWYVEVQDPECIIWSASQLRSASIDGYTATRARYRLHGDAEFTMNGAPFVMPGMPGAYFCWPDQEYPTAAQWTRDILPLINSTSGQTYYGNPVNTPAFPGFFPNGTNRTTP